VIADGSFHLLVIGCDGIKSRVREILLGKGNPASYPHYSHKVAYRGLIPVDKAIEALGEYKALNQHMHIGPKKHVLHFPVAGQTLMNFVAFVTDPDDWPNDEKMTAPATRAEVEEAFADWGPTVQAITNALPDELDKWAIFDSFDHPAPTYARGRICIAGDAAHASSPHHGAGAGIGVEDALCLSTLLELAISSMQEKGTTKGQALSTAFDTFNAVRRERSQWLVNSSRGICEVYEWADPKTGNDPDKCFEEIKWRSHKIWNFDIDGMLKDASEGYEQQLNALATKMALENHTGHLLGTEV
jgi:salicylate hydroxylase